MLYQTKKDMRNLKANVIGIGVVNMTTGNTCYDWSIYENTGFHAFLATTGTILFGSKTTFQIGDSVKLLSNEGRSLARTVEIVDVAPCEKDSLLKMLKGHNYDYYPIRAFKARAKGNKKLGTSYSVKGVSNL